MGPSASPVPFHAFHQLVRRRFKRQAITIPTVQSQMLPGDIGMVSLREFSRVATSERPLVATAT